MRFTNDELSVARSIVEADGRAVISLRDLLIEERGALSRREIEQLNQIVQKKLSCLELLRQSEDHRKRMLARRGNADWATLLAAMDPALATAWSELRTLLGEVAELTEVNERIVARTRSTSSRLLSLLRGRKPGAAGVYDRLGQTRAHDDIRSITSA